RLEPPFLVMGGTGQVMFGGGGRLAAIGRQDRPQGGRGIKHRTAYDAGDHEEASNGSGKNGRNQRRCRRLSASSHVRGMIDASGEPFTSGRVCRGRSAAIQAHSTFLNRI